MAAVDLNFPSTSCCFVSGVFDKYVEVICDLCQNVEAFHHVLSTFVILLHEAHLAIKQQFIILENFWNKQLLSALL
jgi:hypothetical protein